MIPVIPYRRWVVFTPLSREEAARRLSACVQKRVVDRSRARETGAYEGSVSEKGFNINRVIRFEHAFLPVVRGKFRLQGNKLRIEVMATLHTALLLFVLVMVILIVASGLFGHFMNILRLLIVASPFYVGLQIAFVYELFKVRRFLAGVFLETV
ncbi:MAG TPA: hypothetical protein VKQ72_07125 [Aggregatilineales bacterium]|nr:hypothetical protein [Aggregatilineales bacterium]